MKLKIFILITMCSAMFLMTESHRLTKDYPTDATGVIQSVPKPERSEFVAYALGIGFMKQYRMGSSKKYPFPDLLSIPKHLEEKFQEMDKPENFTSDLYLFVKSAFKLNDREMFTLILRREICFPNGKCIDLGNIGELCCPF